MTDPNRSHITILADRTGSMERIKTDAEGGINTFIDEQKAGPGECSLLFVEFDSAGYDIVFDGSIADTPKYTLVPRGATPLLDSIARAIHETGTRLAALDEAQRPGHVYFVVQTDGFENASREYTLDAVKTLIKQQEDEWQWNFVFLATGPDAFGQAQMFQGTQMHANTVAHDSNQTPMAYAAASSSVMRSRKGMGEDFGADLRQDQDDAADQNA